MGKVVAFCFQCRSTGRTVSHQDSILKAPLFLPVGIISQQTKFYLLFHLILGKSILQMIYLNRSQTQAIKLRHIFLIPLHPLIQPFWPVLHCDECLLVSVCLPLSQLSTTLRFIKLSFAYFSCSPVCSFCFTHFLITSLQIFYFILPWINLVSGLMASIKFSSHSSCSSSPSMDKLNAAGMSYWVQVLLTCWNPGGTKLAPSIVFKANDLKLSCISHGGVGRVPLS